ncbi:MAG: CHAP domain-containing protein [Candidatus Falkowbacteria bacterium]|nr:CHAP domain-containing protein [Candidatus Falkowbacteria bacterium]
MFFYNFFRKLILVFLFVLYFVVSVNIVYSASSNETIIYPTKNYSIGPEGATKHIFLGNQVIATIDGSDNSATVYYIYPDHINSSSLVLDRQQKINELTDYYAFGSLRFDNKLAKHDEKRKFIGQEYDQFSNLQYLNARYYDSLSARFISQDPEFWQLGEECLIDPQQQNSYSYSRNNPIVYSDPFGLSAAIYNSIPNGGWRFGQRMGEFNGVVAYYNGVGSSGTTYSCVEFAKRYQSQVYGIKNIGPVGDAKTMWNMVNTINNRLASAKSSYTFTQHVNGKSFNLPSEGDLLFWTEGKYGHVMVVTEAKFDNKTNRGYVEIIDQNASKQAVRSFDVKKTSSGYSILKSDGTAMAGWFSPTSVNEAVKVSNSAPAVKAQANQPSFFKNFWNRVSQFLKR